MTKSQPWRPLFKPDGYDTLTEEFSPPLMDAILLWMVKEANGTSMNAWFTFQLESRIDIGLRTGVHHTFERDVEPLLRKLTPREFANVLDYMLYYFTGYNYVEVGGKLDQLLQMGGSKWQLAFGGHQGLVERVPQGVQQAVEETLRAENTASATLSEAWTAAYGVNPNPSNAYHLAVIATEIAALTVMPGMPEDATLGTVITRLENQKGWSVPFRDSERAPGVDTLARMLRLLWRGQKDRHGSPDYKTVSQAEAQAGVLLAATLVGWFSAGVLSREEE
ncbi:hypothetical protein ACVLV4_000440 [Rathayibacter agropyri]